MYLAPTQTTSHKLRGVVERIVFHNKENSYYVLKMDLQGKSSVVVGTVVGMDIVPGVEFSFLAKAGHHEKFGSQWIIVEAPLSISEWGDDEILSLVKAYGQEGFLYTQLSALKKQGHSISSIVADRGKFEALLGGDQGAILQDSWDSFVGVMEGHRYLHGLGLSGPEVHLLWSKLGAQAKIVLAQDPWMLTEFGIPFTTVDRIADTLQHSKLAPRRILAYMLNVLKDGQKDGDLFGVALEVMAKTKMAIPDITEDAFKKAFVLARESKSLVKATDQGRAVLYTRAAYHVEEDSAALLVQRMVTAVQTRFLPNAEESAEDFESRMLLWVDEWMEPLKLQLTSVQKKAVYAAMVKPVSILTGLPGTGKTTTLKILVKIFQDQGIDFALMAPTGIAAKRMAAVTGADATTIHRAFRARAGGRTRQASYAGIEDEEGRDDRGGDDVGFGWTVLEGAEVVIIDECSMLDQFVLHKIMTCTPETTRLVFVGDAAQLPSVGPGRVLHEMIASGVFRTTDLREIFRQGTTSDIVVAAHAIHAGRVPEAGSDFNFVSVKRDEDVRDYVMEEAQKLLGMGETFQVLSPRHKGVVGVTDLNRDLRRLLNPSLPNAHELKVMQEVIRVGDRVMVCKNDYNHDIYNGDVGKVEGIHFRGGSECDVEVKIFGPPAIMVTLEKAEATKLLRLAYAMTVHKSQGQEYDHIILPWTMSMGRQLQRTLLYTAVTRAKKRVVIVGHWGAVAQAVGTADQVRRNTRFAHLIQDQVRVMEPHGR